MQDAVYGLRIAPFAIQRSNIILGSAERMRNAMSLGSLVHALGIDTLPLNFAFPCALRGTAGVSTRVATPSPVTLQTKVPLTSVMPLLEVALI